MSPSSVTVDPGAVTRTRVEDVTYAQRARGMSTRLTRLADLLRYAETKDAVAVWLEHPITQAYLSALRELSYLPAGEGVLPSNGDALIQYGMTLAFQFSERLMRNPEDVIPKAFSVSGPSEDLPPQAYTTYEDAPDSIVS